VIERRFQNVPRGSDAQADSSTVRQNLSPGDEAAPRTPGTGEDICPLCHGHGRIMRSRCPKCGGAGKIIRGIGGA
jgi:DnaJ-class molecular chaperone